MAREHEVYRRVSPECIAVLGNEFVPGRLKLIRKTYDIYDATFEVAT